MDATELVRRRIHRCGPISFQEYLEIALYDPELGFYSTGGAAGRRGDFLTSPEIGPLFGAVVGRALSRWWEEMGRPDPFVVVEAAAGVGTLAKAVLAAEPECRPALRYLLVERSERLRERQPASVSLEPAATVLGAVAPGAEDGGDDRIALRGDGPRAAALDDLPAGPLVGVVLANELMDNLAFALLARTAAGWAEVRVGEGGCGELVEVLVAASEAQVQQAERLAPDAPVGARIPLQEEAARWLAEALRLLRRGRVVVFDYVATTAELAARPQSEWLRTYRHGGPGSHPLQRPGTQDVTCDVCVDQLARVRRPAWDRPQAEFLAIHGLDELVGEARGRWQAGAAAGSLEALMARSRIDEAAALTDAAGLGAFRVLEWVVD